MKPQLALLLASPTLLAAQICFEEVAAGAGVDFHLRNGAAGRYHQVELMLGGVAVLDYDDDGCMDIYFTNGAALPSQRKTGPQFHNRLYHNNCDLTFTDVTQDAGVAGEGYSMAVATADYDNDGDTDIFVAGVNQNTLYRNEGNGEFEDITKRAMLVGDDPDLGKMWSISAGWFDADNDGWLDLFVSNYVDWDPDTEPSCGPPNQRMYCHPDNYTGRPHQLFHNNGDGTFTDISRASGVAGSIGKGMGVAFGDFNDDNLTDVFVANDSVRNFLFENKGELKFNEVGFDVGVALGEQGRAIAGMGPDFRDFDDDGFQDIVLTGMINDTFLVFRNFGKPFFFEDGTIESGLAAPSKTLTGWGMGLTDFDNDGAKDLFTANSHFPGIGRYAGTHSALPNSVFRNTGGGRFIDVSKQAGDDFQDPAFHRCPAFADFDNDGRVDVVVSLVNAPARLFRNTTEEPGHWLAVKLEGIESNRDGLGAKVIVRLPDGRVLHNHATTSVGYASSSEPLVRFGTGHADLVELLEIRWPSGSRQTISNVQVDRVLEVTEPDN